MLVRGKGGNISECIGPSLTMSHHLHLSILLGNIRHPQARIYQEINTLIDSALVLLNAWQEASMLSLLLKKILRHEPYWKIRSVPFFRTYWADSLLLGPYHEIFVGKQVKDRRKLCPTNLRKTSSVSIKPFETWVVTTVKIVPIPKINSLPQYATGIQIMRISSFIYNWISLDLHVLQATSH